MKTWKDLPTRLSLDRLNQLIHQEEITAKELRDLDFMAERIEVWEECDGLN